MFHLRTPDGKVLEVDENELRRMVEDGRVRAWDGVSLDGEIFIQARGHVDLAGLFPEPAAALTDYCHHHPERVAEVRCRQCGRGYCGECRPREEIGHTTAVKCPACSAPVAPFESRALAKEWWEDPLTLLRYPLAEKSWVTTLGVAFLLWGGMMIPPFTLVLYFLGMAYVVHSIAGAAAGKTTMGYGPDIDDMWAMIGRGFIAWLVLLEVTIPFVVFNLLVFWNAWQGGMFWRLFLLNVPFLLVAWCYYPMALAIAAIWQDKWIAFRPRTVIEHIAAIPGPYAILLLGWIVLLVLERFVGTLIGLITAPFVAIGVGGVMVAFLLRFVLVEMTRAYFLLVGGFMLGRMVFKNESRLGWED